MEKELKSVVWDKYMGSDIDSITLFFEEHTNDSEVLEFKVSEEEQHLVFYSEKRNSGSLNWIEIVNPKEVAKNEKATLPDILVRMEEKVYSLQETVKKIVDAV